MFTFYIIPMLNPDGVIVGNYRTSYSGKDLNRQFQNLEKFIFPEIFYLNELVMDIRKKHFKGV
jgi:murein tripeptide amidase MpaA